MSLNRTKDSIVVITDTSCLIILKKIALLHVLHQLFDIVLTTPEIAAEYGLQLPEWIVIIALKTNFSKANLNQLLTKAKQAQ